MSALLLSLALGSSVPGAEGPDAPVTQSSTAEQTEPGQAATTISVLYLTNRRREEGKSPAGTYTGDRGTPHFGRCEVEFTPIPIVNEVAPKMSFYIKSESVTVTLAEPIDDQQFWGRLDARSPKPVVLFVHGYNYGFERTCRMAADLQRSLQDRATLVVFSWPSNALPTDYVSDQADIEWSVPLLADLIEQLGDRLGEANLRLVAHSLGSRGVILALKQLGAQSAERPAIDHLVLLAPDFDSQTFVELLPRLEPMAGAITLYASSNDTPLKLSHQLSGYPRLGEGGPYLTVVEGMETIDVSSLGRYQLTGHEYFYFHPVVAADLVTLLGTGARAAERSGLQARMRGGIPYWEFQ